MPTPAPAAEAGEGESDPPIPRAGEDAQATLSGPSTQIEPLEEGEIPSGHRWSDDPALPAPTSGVSTEIGSFVAAVTGGPIQPMLYQPGRPAIGSGGQRDRDSPASLVRKKQRRGKISCDYFWLEGKCVKGDCEYDHDTLWPRLMEHEVFRNLEREGRLPPITRKAYDHAISKKKIVEDKRALADPSGQTSYWTSRKVTLAKPSSDSKGNGSSKMDMS